MHALPLGHSEILMGKSKCQKRNKMRLLDLIAGDKLYHKCFFWLNLVLSRDKSALYGEMRTRMTRKVSALVETQMIHTFWTSD